MRVEQLILVHRFRSLPSFYLLLQSLHLLILVLYRLLLIRVQVFLIHDSAVIVVSVIPDGAPNCCWHCSNAATLALNVAYTASASNVVGLALAIIDEPDG